MKRISLTALILLFTVLVASGQVQRQFTDRIFHSSLDQDLPYKVMFPENFDPAQSYPLLLFLHGSGERGTDNNAQLLHGGDRLQSDPTLKGTIVIVPQCPKEDSWVRLAQADNSSGQRERNFPYSAPISSSMKAVKELLDAFIAIGIVDTEQVFGMGISMGGMGILDLTFRYPDLFAAVQPLCGGANNDRASEFKGKTSFRFFHGLRDAVVLPKYSQENCEALKGAGINATIVEYPEDTHNCWDNTFREPNLFTWMFKQAESGK